MEEICKEVLDNGQRKLIKEEKEVIKLAKDSVNNLNELGKWHLPAQLGYSFK